MLDRRGSVDLSPGHAWSSEASGRQPSRRQWLAHSNSPASRMRQLSVHARRCSGEARGADGAEGCLRQPPRCENQMPTDVARNVTTSLFRAPRAQCPLGQPIQRSCRNETEESPLEVTGDIRRVADKEAGVLRVGWVVNCHHRIGAP